MDGRQRPGDHRCRDARQHLDDHQCRDVRQEAAKVDRRYPVFPPRRAGHRCPVAPPEVAMDGWLSRHQGLRLQPRHRRYRGNFRGRHRLGVARVCCRDDSRCQIRCRAWWEDEKGDPQHLRRAWWEVERADSPCRCRVWLEVERADSPCRCRVCSEVEKVDFLCSGDCPMEVVKRCRRRTDAHHPMDAALASMARALRLAWNHPRVLKHYRPKDEKHFHFLRRGANCRPRALTHRKAWILRPKAAKRFHHRRRLLLLRRRVHHRHLWQMPRCYRTTRPVPWSPPGSKKVVRA